MKSAELIYVDAFSYVKPSRNLIEFAKNLKTGFEVYFGTKITEVELLLNTEANTVTISIKFVSPVCEGFIATNPSIRPGLYIVGILKKITEIKRESFHAYKTVVRERQCVALGDEFDEFVITFYLTEKGMREALKIIEPDKWIRI